MSMQSFKYTLISWTALLVLVVVDGFLWGWRTIDVVFAVFFLSSAMAAVAISLYERRRIRTIARLPPAEREQWLASLDQEQRDRVARLLKIYGINAL